MKDTLLVFSILLGGCTSTNIDGALSKSNQTFLVDQSVQMRPLSNEVLRGAHIFPGVETHKINYEFHCGSVKYALTFLVVKENDTHFVSIESFFSDNRQLTSEQFEQINKGIDGYQTVGPVGLKCSSDKPNAALSLIIRGATANQSSKVYDFKNEVFSLSNQDFE
jgi:hypothetical protein